METLELYDKETGLTVIEEYPVEQEVEYEQRTQYAVLTNYYFDIVVRANMTEEKTIFYYSQMAHLTPPYHLDWLIEKFFERYKKKPDELKSFVRGYHEITKNVSHSTYLINANFFSVEGKHNVMENLYPHRRFENIPDETIDVLFNQMLFREIKYLEHDIQSFS